MVLVCETCGGPDFSDCFIFCQKCSTCAVHRGSFCIRGYRYGEMRAHLSNTACEKVFLVARSMPTRLSIHVHQRSDVWPKSFQKSPPHGGHIALYFFPNSESAKDEHSFEMLLHDLISSDLALKVFFDDSELLVFPSLQLPEQYHCFHERYYIWGVFKNRSSDGLPHIDGNLRKGRASLHSSDHMPGKIMDSVDSLPSIISSPSLRSPTPDDIEPDGMVDSVKIKLRSGSEDSIIGKMMLPHACLSHPQQLEPSHCEIEKLQRDEVTENLLVPLDMKTCYSMLRRSGLCEQDCEDLAVMVRMGDSSGINLELGLGRMTAKQGGYKNTKPLEPGRSLLC